MNRGTRLETALLEGTKELLKERAEKQELQVRVEEMQTSIEQRIQEFRKHLNDSGRTTSEEVMRLKQENVQLRNSLQEMKVCSRLAQFLT